MTYTLGGGRYSVTIERRDDTGSIALTAYGSGGTAEDAFKDAVSNIASALSKSESEKEGETK